MTSFAAFDGLPEVYEAMIDWPKRLAHETPFYRRLVGQLDAMNVADVACGTGRHAAMLHGWGLRVEGSDISPEMIQRARSQFGEPDGLRWVVRGYDEPICPAQPLDLAICVGNSLALAPDMATVERALSRMLEGVRPAGVIVVQVLNPWRLPMGSCMWQKCMRARLSQGEVLIIKGVTRFEHGAAANLLIVNLEGEPVLKTHSARFLEIERDDLQQMARRGGASEVKFYGSYDHQPFDRRESTDLIMVARK